MPARPKFADVFSPGLNEHAAAAEGAMMSKTITMSKVTMNISHVATASQVGVVDSAIFYLI